MIGKTGTAQIASENGGGYLDGKEDIISSFSGIYPKSNPQVIIYASVKRPSGGSQKPLSNAVKEIVENVSKYYGNSDTQTATITVSDYVVPSFVNKKLDIAKTTLEASGVSYVILGHGNKVMKQTPNKNEVITNKDTVYLITNDAALTIPNVVGLSSKVANDLLTKMGVIVNLDGVGYVTEQSLAEGTPITDGLVIDLKLAPKFAAE